MQVYLHYVTQNCSEQNLYIFLVPAAEKLFLVQYLYLDRRNFLYKIIAFMWMSKFSYFLAVLASYGNTTSKASFFYLREELFSSKLDYTDYLVGTYNRDHYPSPLCLRVLVTLCVAWWDRREVRTVHSHSTVAPTKCLFESEGEKKKKRKCQSKILLAPQIGNPKKCRNEMCLC